MIQRYLVTVLFFFTPYAEKTVATTAFSVSFKRIQKNDGPGGVIFTGAFLRSVLRRVLRSKSIRLKDGYSCER